MDTISFKLPTIDQVDFTITPEEEDIDPRYHIERLNDDKKFINQFVKDVNENLSISPFGWCSIKVTAYYKGQEGINYLACCSYRSEEDFKKGGYYEQMREEAYEDLITQLKELAD